MPGYVIADITVVDEALYEKYRALTPETISKYGGRFVVRGGAHETIEGDWKPGRLVVLEFDDIASAKQWYNSPEYSEARSIRHKAATDNMIFVEG